MGSVYGMQKTISSKDELLQWAREINNGLASDVKRKCDYQDYYMRATRADLDRWFLESDMDRRLVICSVNNVLAFDEVERLLGVLARAKVERAYEESERDIDKRYVELAAKERIFEECKKPIFKRIASLKRENRKLQAVIDSKDRYISHMVEINRAAKKEAAAYHEKAARYDRIRDCLNLEVRV
jgi:hypothetical protein